MNVCHGVRLLSTAVCQWETVGDCRLHSDIFTRLTDAVSANTGHVVQISGCAERQSLSKREAGVVTHAETQRTRTPPALWPGLALTRGLPIPWFDCWHWRRLHWSPNLAITRQLFPESIKMKLIRYLMTPCGNLLNEENKNQTARPMITWICF